jgi:hypothetical protein
MGFAHIIGFLKETKMLVYIDQDENRSFEDCDSIETKDKITQRFHNIARQEMRDNDYTEFKYSIIDFAKDQSTVYIMTRKTTETFTITGC